MNKYDIMNDVANKFRYYEGGYILKSYVDISVCK